MKNRNKRSDAIILASIILVVLFVDQIAKIYVKSHFCYGESVEITNWFHLTLIENNGMAFGTKILPKLLLTMFRLLFACYLIWYMNIMLLTKHKQLYLYSVAFIIAGAFGNLVDNVFYGRLFTSNSIYKISEITFFEGDSAPWFYGKVVDMLYFPLFHFCWPEFLPFIGGQNFIFFSPIFNVADAAVSCGTIVLFLVYPKSLTNSIRIVKLLILQKLHKHLVPNRQSQKH